MSEADGHIYGPPVKEYQVTLVRPANETVTIGGDEARTVEQAVELAESRGQGSLCHQCAGDLDLGDYTGHVVSIVEDGETEPTEVRNSFEWDRRHEAAAIRNATLSEIADALAAASTGEPNGTVRNKLREVAVKLRGAQMAGGKVDLR
jgi:hypothetical protein